MWRRDKADDLGKLLLQPRHLVGQVATLGLVCGLAARTVGGEVERTRQGQGDLVERFAVVLAVKAAVRMRPEREPA